MPHNISMENCPLGIVEVAGICDPSKCLNREYCEDQASAWLLPYEFTWDGYLMVRTFECLEQHERYWDEAVESAEGAYMEHLDQQYSREHALLLHWLKAVHSAGWNSPEWLPYTTIQGCLVVNRDNLDDGFSPAVPLSERLTFAGEQAWNDYPEASELFPEIP